MLRASLGCVALEARENPTSGVTSTGWYAFTDANTSQEVFAYVVSDDQTPADWAPGQPVPQFVLQLTTASVAAQNLQPGETTLWTDWQNAVFVDGNGNQLATAPAMPLGAIELLAITPDANLAGNQAPAPQPPAPQPPAPQPPAPQPPANPPPGQIPPRPTPKKIEPGDSIPLPGGGSIQFPLGGEVLIGPGGTVVILPGPSVTVTPPPTPIQPVPVTPPPPNVTPGFWDGLRFRLNALASIF